MAKRAPQTHRWEIYVEGDEAPICGTSSSENGATSAMNNYAGKIRQWGEKAITAMTVTEIV